MKVSQLKEQIRRVIRERFISESTYKLGSQKYTSKSLSPTEIHSLAMEYLNTSVNKMYGSSKKMDSLINVANDLARLTGTTQQSQKERGKPALLLQLLKNNLVDKSEYIKLYNGLKDKQESVIKTLKNADPASRMVGGAAARQAYKDMKGEFEESVDEAITNPKKTNPSDLAKTVLGWFDFYTDYIDDGGQRRRAIKNNEDTLVWFGSHPKDVKEKAYKIMLSQSKDKGQIERNFGKHLKESVIKEDTRRVKLLGIDFKVSEINGRIFFSFVDKKAAIIQLRKVGTNKIVNHIQNRLDIAYGKGEFFFKSGDHAEFQNGYLFQRNTSNINLNKIKFESVNEGLYHVGYNKGRGQGTGVFKDSYSSYKDAKKAVEKLEKERGGSYNQIAYYVADKDGKLVRESINESTEPEVISRLRDIVKNKQYQDVKDPASGKKMKVDMQTANTVLKIYDGLSNVNKQTMVKMGLPKMIDVSNKIISKYKK
jgi:hypothetical protein